MKKKLIYIGIFASLLVSCTESLEDKAAREAKEYTEKYCPTPYVNDSRTDSAAFDKNTKTCTLTTSLCETRRTTRRRLMPTRINSIKFRKRHWTTTLV